MTLNTLPLSNTLQDSEKQRTATATGPSYILSCPYCQWSTLDVDLTFSKPTNLFEQIVAHQQLSRSGPLTQSSEIPPSSSNQEPRFNRLKSHLLSPLSLTNNSSANPLLTPSGTLNYDSPSSLARIMALYTTSLTPYGKKSTTKNSTMREAHDVLEGLAVFDPEADIAAVEKLKAVGWEGTISGEQRREQQVIHHSEVLAQQAKFQDSLRPIPMLMRTKRAKRCRACRHILVKPEAKVSSTRYRIRLIASNTLPSISLKPLSSLPAAQQPPPSSSKPPLDPPSSSLLSNLPSDTTPQQFLLTLSNPLFERVRITLAAPTSLPIPSPIPNPRLRGSDKYTHRITLLCPTFDIGANTDAWDEALSKDPDVPTGTSSRESKRASAALLAGNATNISGTSAGVGGTAQKVAEAGKIWEKGRNWTTVVLEVSSRRNASNRNPAAERTSEQAQLADDDDEEEDEKEDENEYVDKDEDVLEIPIFVRMEWEAEGASASASASTTGGDGAAGGGGLAPGSKTGREKRELGYWMVVGVGRMG